VGDRGGEGGGGLGGKSPVQETANKPSDVGVENKSLCITNEPLGFVSLKPMAPASVATRAASPHRGTRFWSVKSSDAAAILAEPVYK